jgi:hypothetical protein
VPTYQIKIRRRLLLGWKSYIVIAHATEILGSSARLVLEFIDGSKLAIPRIEKRTVMVYP